MAKVFKNTYTKNGKKYQSSTYYFKAVIDGKRRNYNTELTNKKDAEQLARNFEATGILSKPSPLKPTTIITLVEELGWLNPNTNPKLLMSRSEKRYYGESQARSIASAFKHMFSKMEVLDNFHTFLRRKKVLKTSKFEYYTTFLTKPPHTLTHQDAINFLAFLDEYTTYLRNNPMPKHVKFFMLQNRMNIVALKSFYTYTVEIAKDENFPENLFKGRRIPNNNKKMPKAFLEMTYTKRFFNDDFANRVKPGFASDYVYRALKFGALTGMRSAEVRALHYEQFDATDNHILTIDRAFKANTIKKNDIGLPKWDKKRTIYLCDSALECVGPITPSSKGFVFVGGAGNPISTRFYIDVLERYFRMIDVFYYEQYGEFYFGEEHYTPHSLRGGLNSYLLSTGELRAHLIQHYFGWTKDSLTPVQDKHYTKISPLESFKVAKAIEKGFSGRTMEDPSVFMDTKMEDNLDKLDRLMNVEREKFMNLETYHKLSHPEKI